MMIEMNAEGEIDTTDLMDARGQRYLNPRASIQSAVSNFLSLTTISSWDTMIV